MAALLKSEVKMESIHDIYPSIFHIDRVLKVFVKSGNELERVKAEAKRRGLTADQLIAEKHALADRLAAFEHRLDLGDTGVGNELARLLPAVDAAWVTVTDVWALHLMVQAERGERAERYAARLADASTRWLKQMMDSLRDDAEMEKLAVELLELFERPVTPPLH
jgi:hypothetical protein